MHRAKVHKATSFTERKVIRVVSNQPPVGEERLLDGVMI
jgi:hypothetical protein